VHKKWGETPLECLERLRIEEGIASDVPMTYAGRLDPAAEGLLLILVGEECKKKDEYTKLDKTYVAEIVFGVSTDSYDLLGMPTLGTSGGVSREAVENYLKSIVGKHTQKYPPYSSKTVDGKQLHTHAKEGNDVELPTHEVELFGYSDLALGERSREDVLERVEKLAEMVTGDFRQKEIAEAWRTLGTLLPEKLSTVTVTLKVGSGFYIRSLAEDIGSILKTGATLVSLRRTGISL
jgi:tRNA pseudouridine(55) synthase